MLFWPIAATAPKIIEATAKNIMIVCQWFIRFIKGTYINLIKTDNAAIFGTKAKKLVTDVGDPSYTSGTHMWNGTAETLNDSPTNIKTIPKTAGILFSFKFSEIVSKFVDPVNP